MKGGSQDAGFSTVRVVSHGTRRLGSGALKQSLRSPAHGSRRWCSRRRAPDTGVTPRELCHEKGPLGSPDGAQRNLGAAPQTPNNSVGCSGDPDSAALHPGYGAARTATLPGGRTRPRLRGWGSGLRLASTRRLGATGIATLRPAEPSAEHRSGPAGTSSWAALKFRKHAPAAGRLAGSRAGAGEGG